MGCSAESLEKGHEVCRGQMDSKKEDLGLRAKWRRWIRSHPAKAFYDLDDLIRGDSVD
jgi:hypothetical protein